jgi:tetratricopeptide (TPR) repeat protein
MARSFYRQTPDNVIEDYERNNHLFHADSNRHYRMIRRGDRFFQQRYQRDADGRESHLFEQEVTFIIGSGNHSRSYVNLSDGGVLTQLPVSWYPQEKRWAMSPGYDRPRHHDFSRKIDYGCMFCHNAYPQLAEGADLYGRETLFPRDLPQGINCQRCHGPGSQHVELAGRGQDATGIRKAIVNPAHLSPDRQMDVCQQCHLETTSDELPQAVRRFGRGVYTFRPGEALADYMVYFDHAPGTGHDDKFEINGSAYRLRKSACFLRSEGRLVCTTCHNPHRTPKGTEAVRHFRESCQKCHSTVQLSNHPGPESDCVRCHMPKRRTEDVVHVTMTDHWIQRRPPARNLLAQLKEDHRPYRGEVVFYRSEPSDHSPSTRQDSRSVQTHVSSSLDPLLGKDGRRFSDEIYWAIAQVKQQSNLREGLVRLKALVQQEQPANAEPWVELALAQGEAGDLESAKETFWRALERDSGLVLARYNLGRVCQLLGQLSETAAHYREVLQLDPQHSEAHNNLGVVHETQEQLGLAAEHFRRAMVRNPLFVDAYSNLGNLLARQQRWDEAEECLQQALRIEPASADAWNNLGKIAGARGELDGAIRHFRQPVTADPKHWIAHFNLGRALEADGKSREAQGAYREAKRLNPKLETTNPGRNGE